VIGTVAGIRIEGKLKKGNGRNGNGKMGNLPGVIIQWHRVGHAGITRAISASREGASANK